MIVNDSAECSLCTMGPPPDMILRLPPPPIPTFLVHSSDYYPGVGASDGLPFFEHFNNSPCKHSCEWRAEGVQYVEMPQQGALYIYTYGLFLSLLSYGGFAPSVERGMLALYVYTHTIGGAMLSLLVCFSARGVKLHLRRGLTRVGDFSSLSSHTHVMCVKEGRL